MKCPQCGFDEKHAVRETRRDAGQIRRSRRCAACGHIFKTIENVSEDGMMVRKSDGSVVPFTRSAIAKSIKKATVKAYERKKINGVVDAVTEAVYEEAARPGGAVSSLEIGKAVLKELANDQASRIRYALVQTGRTDRSDLREGWANVEDFRRWLLAEYSELEHYPARSKVSYVVKRNGKREKFDRPKLERSIGLASKGRGSDGQVWDKATVVADHVLRMLGDQPIVTSGQIAAEILRFLREKDHIAYLRFASTVKEFENAEEYEEEALALRKVRITGWDEPLS
jgi:transcriptional regulator NrdR family protein